MPHNFDLDSFIIGVDNCASATISNNPNHFEDLQPTHDKGCCHGFGDKEGHGAVVTGICTFVFTIHPKQSVYPFGTGSPAVSATLGTSGQG